MPTLPKDLRSKLEKAVLAAREEATEGARVALTALGVGDAKRAGHLDAAGEALRRRLRARGRQAGDQRKPDNSQDTEHLMQECAYEHWHRMLFARFLAENELLRHPEMGVAVSLEECEELARDEGLDLWELAASFAQHMLPEVFRQDNPVLHLRLPTEARNKLTAILGGLPPAVFTADDSLGWTYQFWQTKRKKEVNESGDKIGADEISPVTQLFTEDYMVEFLLHNTLGAWWAGRCASVESEKFKVGSEDEARAAASLPPEDGLPGIDWTYLRFIRKDGEAADPTLITDHSALGTSWTPAAGTFGGWPNAVKDVTFLDPCMGSGHFPVFALPILARLRMEEEDLSAAEAVHAVLRDNIHGLELDPRCCQIGAFNLALTAWKLAGHQPLPAFHIACCGLAPQAKLADWIALAGDNDRLRRGMERLYKLFEQAPVLGSLINPRLGGGDLLEADFHELQPLLEQAMVTETNDVAAHEMAVTAQGLAKAAEILAGQFTMVATNVPYLGSAKQNEILKEYCGNHYPEAKADLATCFAERCIDYCGTNGTSSIVIPQNWLFLGTYKKLRFSLLEKRSWNTVARLGPKGFQTPMWDFNIVLVSISAGLPDSQNQVFGLDVGDKPSPAKKSQGLQEDFPVFVSQADQLRNPDARFVLGEAIRGDLLSKYADSYWGQGTGDFLRFGRSFWELPSINAAYDFVQSTVSSTLNWGGRELVVFWENGNGQLVELAEELRARLKNIHRRGQEAWGRQGASITLMSELKVTRYGGQIFDGNCAALVPKDPAHLPAVWSFCSSPDFNSAVREIDQKLNVTNHTLLKVPFDLAYWQEVAAEKYPDGLPKPHSDDPTQWLFNGHPAGSEQPLQVAVARLLGYRWPRQTGSSFPDCPALGPDGLEAFADEDGIVCLTPVRGEENAPDRLRQLLRAALGTFDERQLIAAAGKKSSKSKTLEDWLRDEFFEQHCDLFQQRPFIWHLWDGRKDGFHALVNYHQLAAPNGAGRRTLESLTYGYLGDWIARQTDAVNQNESGADDRLAAALELKGLLEKILAGEPPYDLFVRWKPLHEQAIGWAPDINDGVRLNARPFLVTDLKRGKKGAGLFRSKVNLKWTKDRGNEPQRPKDDYPWFWSWDEKTQDFAGGSKFDGNRWNDLHYTTAFKQAARDQHQKETTR